jgi:predicted PurR-regulated permease PerM
LLDYYRINLKTFKLRAKAAFREAGGVLGTAPPRVPAPDSATPLSTAGHILSAWYIAPFVFLFLLRDTGEIKRGLLSMVPNRLFEPVLTVLEDLDHGLGDYVRGIFLECVALGSTAVLLLAIVGVSPRWAMAIGIFTAAMNVIPYMGTAAALVAGLAYALLVEEIHPLLPMVNTENLAFWVIAAVGVAELLKNILYEPLILGGAVKLHPLMVVIGVVGGGILFGFSGVLLAIPAITVFKVLVSSTVRQLKAYGLM